MFYDKQPLEQQNNYKKMLKIMGNLSALYSKSYSPYLAYRVHENTFCKYFNADNLGRKDCSADAVKDKIGIGLKTWTGNDDQKVAEFGKLREKYKNLSGIELVKKISEYRNDRIKTTKNIYGISEMIYHIVKRIPGSMLIYEHSFDYISIDDIKILDNRGNENNTYFTDGKHTYHFSVSKNTLYMLFDDMILLDDIEVEIMNDPFDYLMMLSNDEELSYRMFAEPALEYQKPRPKACLRLYSMNKNGKFIPEHSGLNQWNAKGRKRNFNEVYIPFPREDNKIYKDFFPPRDTSFKLRLPDGKIINAKVCQQGDKAIMSNPNKELGEWLLRQVFELKEGEIITYEKLESSGIDCVIFTKNDDFDYSIDFGQLGTYEDFIRK